MMNNTDLKIKNYEKFVENSNKSFLKRSENAESVNLSNVMVRKYIHDNKDTIRRAASTYIVSERHFAVRSIINSQLKILNINDVDESSLYKSLRKIGIVTKDRMIAYMFIFNFIISYSLIILAVGLKLDHHVYVISFIVCAFLSIMLTMLMYTFVSSTKLRLFRVK